MTTRHQTVHHPDCIIAAKGDSVLVKATNYIDDFGKNSYGREYRVLRVVEDTDGYYKYKLEHMLSGMNWWLWKDQFDLVPGFNFTEDEIKSAHSFPDHSQLERFLEL